MFGRRANGRSTHAAVAPLGTCWSRWRGFRRGRARVVGGGLLLLPCAVTVAGCSLIARVPLAPPPLAECAAVQPASAPAGDAVDLRVLSFNVKGLGARLGGGNQGKRNQRIAALLPRYDVVLLQEDFEYHHKLVARDAFAVVERGNGPRRDFRTRLASVLTAPLRWIRPLRFSAPYGSGLTTLARELPAVEVTREMLPGCRGWYGDAADCWASKGFLRVRLRLPNGAEVDVYNLHLDAGSGRANRDVRRRQLRRLAARIRELSGERALIVGGDFNSPYGDPDDLHAPVPPATGPEWAQLRDELVVPLRLVDSGARPVDRDARDQLDYLFFRGGDSVRVESAAPAGEDACLRGLSDHPAIQATLRVWHDAPRAPLTTAAAPGVSARAGDGAGLSRGRPPRGRCYFFGAFAQRSGLSLPRVPETPQPATAVSSSHSLVDFAPGCIW